MKFRQKFAAILAALMLATSLPTFAASTNGVSKVITVAKGTELENTIAPELKIELKDNLGKGETFYLELENAEWSTQAAINLKKDTKLDEFDFSLESPTQLGVTAKDEVKKNIEAYRIPMFAKVTGGDAAVIIDSNDTVVTAGKYVFATANAATGVVSVADAKSFATTGKMADITIEESHIGAFQDDKNDKTIRFELEGTDVKFNYTTDTIKKAFVGKKSYSNEEFRYDAKIIDDTTLEVTIPANTLKATQRGAFTLTGVELRANKGAEYGDVNVTVSGDLNETTEVLVAKYRDYGTDLTVAKEYTATAGQQLKDVEFTLSETVADSINGNRETIFAFSEGVTIEKIEVVTSKLEGIKNKVNTKEVDVPVATIEKNKNEFVVRSIATESAKKTAITFKATLKVPAAFAEDINLLVEGRSLEEKKEIQIAKVTAPVEVDVTAATLKVGLAKQEGGKVVIKETEKGKLSSGKIFLAIDDSDIKYTKAPEVKVTEGNLKVEDEAKLVPGGIEITVKGRSTKASTLEISGGELKVDRTVPEGDYAVKVGGNAISAYSAATLQDPKTDKYNDIDEITEKDFIIIGTRNTEDINNGIKNKAVFVIGQSNYTINGEEKAMDTSAYISAGRTMLPVRYVADALGIDPTQILWDNQNKTVTILAERVIQIKLGSKSMVINGATIPMTAAAELKNERVFIPVAEIARALGANVAWDEVTKTATFN